MPVDGVRSFRTMRWSARRSSQSSQRRSHGEDPACGSMLWTVRMSATRVSVSLTRSASAKARRAAALARVEPPNSVSGQWTCSAS
jgi:hypothetical protein